MKVVFFSAILSDTNEQCIELIERDVDLNPAELHIDVSKYRDHANNDPTLASFHEVRPQSDDTQKEVDNAH